MNESLSIDTLSQNVDPWTQLRSPSFLETVKTIIERSAPDGIKIIAIEHLRTAHYVACKVMTDSKEWLARVGVIEDSDTNPVNNTGYLGASTFVPTGQAREYSLALELASAGVSVAVPEFYEISHSLENTVNHDVLWLSFLNDSGKAMTAVQWGKTLRPLHKMIPSNTLPVFTNRSKTIARLDSMTDRVAARKFLKEYDEGIEKLFDVATQWSAVHGDSHCGNVLITSGKPVLFDFDTVCWAPSVWDLTHLLSRVGTERNTGYTAEELISEFDFTDKELNAALDLRSVASRVAKAVR